MRTPTFKKPRKHEAAWFEILPEARARVGGALEFSTVTALLPSGTEAIEQGRASALDLSGVTASDSAGLALLIEWLSVAKAAGRILRYENIPSQLRQLSVLSDVDELLLGA
ncbi:MAG TPA: STAS domain-containing protein [Steroidobacteraceae bacterium]